MASIDVEGLRDKVKAMYQAVADEPHGTFHFEMGYDLAARLGYPKDELDQVPPEAIESFAGVGHHLALADLKPGDRVVDLGSGSGMDAFLAARQVGADGEVVGVDMTEAQLAKSRRLAERDGVTNTRFEQGYIEQVPVAAGSASAVISNGVINLCSDKAAVFREIARILEPGGRMAISDIVTEHQLTEAIVCDVNLWASCIGGAMQQDDYRAAIEAAGLLIETVQENPEYEFISDSAQGATDTFGDKSIGAAGVPGERRLAVQDRLAPRPRGPVVHLRRWTSSRHPHVPATTAPPAATSGTSRSTSPGPDRRRCGSPLTRRVSTGL